jgi:uncharacterized protein YndB with AHSA1/START domain/DNA-binding transcriptional ArsR family regulator
MTGRSGTDDQAVFKALADPIRRALLDKLRAENGLTLSALCADLDIRRQSVTQHLDLLVEANLVSVHRHGRERLHYLNPVPISELRQRWIASFDEPRLRVLDDIKRKAETMTESATAESGAPAQAPDYVYVTYIRAEPQQVWQALTDPDVTAKYWGHRNVSDWQVGSEWKHIRVGTDTVDVVGEVLTSEPPHLLETIWRDPADPQSWDQVKYRIEAKGPVTKLTVTHSNLSPKDRISAMTGWRVILSNLKTLLETGEPLAANPWELG